MLLWPNWGTYMGVPYEIDPGNYDGGEGISTADCLAGTNGFSMRACTVGANSDAADPVEGPAELENRTGGEV